MNEVRERASDAFFERQVETFASVFEDAPFFVAVSEGAEHRLRVANRAFRSLLVSDEVIGRRLVSCCPEIVSQRFADALDEVFTTGEPITAERVSVEVRGRERDPVRHLALNVTFQPLETAEGQVGGVHIHGVDVTEEVRAHEQVAEKEARFRSVLESALDAAYRRDLQRDEYDYMSPVVERLTGFTAEEMKAMSFEEVIDRIHPDDLSAVMEGVERAARHGHATLEYRWFHKAGHTSWLADHFTIHRDARGEPLYRTGVVRDITQRREAEETLQRLNDTLEARVAEQTQQVRELASELTVAEQKERERIASVLHDDLQQQIYALGMKLHFARRAVETDRPQQALAHISEAASWVERGVDTARSLSAGLSPPIDEESAFAATLQWLAERMREMHGLELQVIAAKDGKELPAATHLLLFQSVRELLFNVAKHAETRAATVRLTGSEDHLQVTVSDDGKGFSTADLCQTDCDGFGLGSVQKRIRLIGGEVEIRSAPGEGTRTTITLPKR